MHPCHLLPALSFWFSGFLSWAWIFRLGWGGDGVRRGTCHRSFFSSPADWGSLCSQPDAWYIHQDLGHKPDAYQLKMGQGKGKLETEPWLFPLFLMGDNKRLNCAIVCQILIYWSVTQSCRANSWVSLIRPELITWQKEQQRLLLPRQLMRWASSARPMFNSVSGAGDPELTIPSQCVVSSWINFNLDHSVHEASIFYFFKIVVAYPFLFLIHYTYVYVCV